VQVSGSEAAKKCHAEPMPKPTSKPRSTSQIVASHPSCAPLLRMYQAAERARPRTWGEVEDAFVRAMEEFDANVAAGIADIGDLQNGKGDFLNDLLALLLEGCGGVQLFSRGGVRGFVFESHNLDVTYPNTGIVRFTLEVKAVGTPRHPLSPKQKAIGRPGSADLAKRVKEAAFKTIDLKAEFGRIMAASGQAASAPGATSRPGSAQSRLGRTCSSRPASSVKPTSRRRSASPTRPLRCSMASVSSASGRCRRPRQRPTRSLTFLEM
jgi:hypothetical protein